MYFMIKATDKENSLNQRLALRPQHLERLMVLQRQNRLLMAGPLTLKGNCPITEAGVQGSLIVAEFDSIEAAKEWAHQDPFFTHGVYSQVEILHFLKVFPT